MSLCLAVHSWPPVGHACKECMPMRTHTYSERDYAFGQAMATLRTAMNLTQAGLAQLLGVSRGAVLGWEAGSSYPKAERLKGFIALGVELQAFPAGQETLAATPRAMKPL